MCSQPFLLSQNKLSSSFIEIRYTPSSGCNHFQGKNLFDPSFFGILNRIIRSRGTLILLSQCIFLSLIWAPDWGLATLADRGGPHDTAQHIFKIEQLRTTFHFDPFCTKEMKGDSTIWSLARKKMAGSIATVGNLMNCTYRTSAMPTIMVGETPKNSFGKQASTRKLWLELMGSSVWYGKALQELSWRICFIQPQKKPMNYECIFPYLKVNLDHGTVSMAAMGFTHRWSSKNSNEHPTRNKKYGGESTTQKKTRNKNVGFETNHLLPRYS